MQTLHQFSLLIYPSLPLILLPGYLQHSGLWRGAIGYIGASNRYRSNQQHLAGYQLAYAQANLPQTSDWIAFSDAEYTATSDVTIGQQMLPQLLKVGVTAIFCYNDMVAVGALLTCQKLGIVVPRDLSLVGLMGLL